MNTEKASRVRDEHTSSLPVSKTSRLKSAVFVALLTLVLIPVAKWVGEHIAVLRIAIEPSASQAKQTGSRTMNTPANRLVGHWGSKEKDNHYYSTINKEGYGNYVLINGYGYAGHHRYVIVDQVPDGERITVKLMFSDGTTREESYVIDYGGTTLQSTMNFSGTVITSSYHYVDDRQEP